MRAPPSASGCAGRWGPRRRRLRVVRGVAAGLGAHAANARTGLHERILRIRADVYGSIAHAYVSFEGYVPGEEQARTRGLDSLQFVRDGPRWLLISFTTQYERLRLPMPARFL